MRHSGEKISQQISQQRLGPLSFRDYVDKIQCIAQASREAI